ncbi:hypothetical protein [Streptomyces sp. DH37]|uniref:hypothetical protein n=1 Tax=Streptomyces sp. DH37 TaxID=3040122 RepID=UPI003014978D
MTPGRFTAALRSVEADGGHPSFRGDPACDTMPAWTLPTAAAREPFREAAGADDAIWARGRGWALCLGLTALHSYRVTSPVLADVGRRAVEEVLADREFAVWRPARDGGGRGPGATASSPWRRYQAAVRPVPDRCLAGVRPGAGGPEAGEGAVTAGRSPD